MAELIQIKHKYFHFWESLIQLGQNCPLVCKDFAQLVTFVTSDLA